MTGAIGKLTGRLSNRIGKIGFWINQTKSMFCVEKTTLLPPITYLADHIDIVEWQFL
jgi:hypothetical protein